MIHHRKCFGKRDSTRDRKKGTEIKVSHRTHGFMWPGIFIERERGGKEKEREKSKECKVGINKLMPLALIGIDKYTMLFSSNVQIYRHVLVSFVR